MTWINTSNRLPLHEGLYEIHYPALKLNTTLYFKRGEWWGVPPLSHLKIVGIVSWKEVAEHARIKRVRSMIWTPESEPIELNLQSKKREKYKPSSRAIVKEDF